jgi:hypothetical protein
MHADRANTLPDEYILKFGTGSRSSKITGILSLFTNTICHRVGVALELTT